MAEPAGQRLAPLSLQTPGDEEEGGRPRPAIEIFVAAADREIGIAAGEVDR